MLNPTPKPATLDADDPDTGARAATGAGAPPASIARADRRVTSYDVARLAGVSQSAVSRCFKPGASVSKATYARVMKAAQSLAFTPNAAARSLITRRSNLVAVIISSRANLLHPQALSELSQQIARRGKRPLLLTLARDSDLERALADVWNFQVDGVIAAAALSEQQLDEFVRRRVPLVMFNGGAAGQAVDAVLCDQHQAGYALVATLAAAGHRQFAILDGPAGARAVQERLAGASACLAELKLPALLRVDGAHDYASGALGLRSAIEQLGGLPDAVLCGNDVMAIGCLDMARHELGLSVPGQLSVASFDAVKPSSWLGDKLTTLRQPIEQMADAAADLLAALIDGQTAAPERRVFEAKLVSGATARLSPRLPASAAPATPATPAASAAGRTGRSTLA